MKTNKEYFKLEADLWRTLCERDAAVKALSLARESIVQMIDYGKASAESEREACAKVAEEHTIPSELATLIRARGTT